MGYFNTNKFIALAIVGIAIILMVWKFNPLLGGEWTIMQKLVLTIAGILIPGYIIWAKESN